MPWCGDRFLLIKMNFRALPGIDNRAMAELEAWSLNAPGSITVGLENQLLSRILPDLFGYHIVQLGCHYCPALLTSTRISHQVLVHLAGQPHPVATMQCAEDALPFSPNSIDVLVLPHVLEFAEDPRRVLREAERVLIGEGHIVIFGFNPWSWYGLWSLVLRWQGVAPWSGRFIGATRAKDWLQLLGFDIIHLSRASFRPPTRRITVNKRLEFLERLGAFCWPWFGNTYLLVGRKRVEGVTPLKASWQQRRRVAQAGSIAEPSTRESGRVLPP
jgi:SAM-dependent methyltransferase